MKLFLKAYQERFLLTRGENTSPIVASIGKLLAISKLLAVFYIPHLSLDHDVYTAPYIYISRFYLLNLSAL